MSTQSPGMSTRGNESTISFTCTITMPSLKAAASMITRLFGVRLAETGIGVYEVRPGIIETDMTRPAKAKYDALIKEHLIPAERWGYPEDVASTVTCR